MKAGLRVLYPPQCLSCSAPVDQDGALCPECWRDCRFIHGCCCACCGAPLPGDSSDGGEHGGAEAQDLLCDGCLSAPPPWQRGRAALVYDGAARGLVLALKHGDRPDLAGPLARWLIEAARPLAVPGMLVAPVPLHPARLMRRKYNQAALLSVPLARALGLDHDATLLKRVRATAPQDRRGVAERFANQRDAIAVSRRRRPGFRGRAVLLVDDVMASGATLSVATQALQAAGAGPVHVAVVARAVRD